jgi:hypothetical protein
MPEIMPQQGGYQLDPMLQQYMQQQRQMQFFNTLKQLGQGFLRSAGGPAARFAGAFPQGQGGGGGMLDMIRLQDMLERQRDRQTKRERARKQDFAQDALAAGDRYDPGNQILWDQPPAAGQEQPAATEQQRQGLLAQAYPEPYGKAQIEREFPAPVDYSTPTTVLGPDGKPQLVRFPKKGTGAPRPVEGYQPYSKPGEAPALLQYADAYKAAMAKEGKPVSDAVALRWARTSVSKSPEEVWVSVYNTNRRAFEDDAAARKMADEISKYVASFQTGGPPAQATAPTPSPSLPGAAEAAVPSGPGVPQRKPNLAGQVLPIEDETAVALDPTLKARVDGGEELNDAELQKLKAENPGQFWALYDYVKSAR